MKAKAVIPLVLGLGMGFIAIKMAVGLIQKARGSTVDTVGVLVASQPIDAGTLISANMVKMAAVPTALAPPGVFSKAEDLDGRVAFMSIATGLPISAEMLAPPGAQPGLPSQIPDGYRALSIKVDESTAVAGFVMPGHRVDVYTVDNPKYNRGQRRNQNPVSRLLLEDVAVGAVGQSTKTVDPDGKSTKLTRSVTLYVRPEDVPALDLASRGSIRLVLRGSRDSEAGNAGRFANGLAKFFQGLQKAQPKRPSVKPAKNVQVIPPAVAKAPPHIIQVYRGLDREVLTFASVSAQVPLSASELRATQKGRAADNQGTARVRLPAPRVKEKTR